MNFMKKSCPKNNECWIRIDTLGSVGLAAICYLKTKYLIMQ